MKSFACSMVGLTIGGFMPWCLRLFGSGEYGLLGLSLVVISAFCLFLYRYSMRTEELYPRRKEHGPT